MTIRELTTSTVSAAEVRWADIEAHIEGCEPCRRLLGAGFHGCDLLQYLEEALP